MAGLIQKQMGDQPGAEAMPPEQMPPEQMPAGQMDEGGDEVDERNPEIGRAHV